MSRIRLRGWALAGVLAIAVSMTACLAPGAPDPTGHAPFGNLDLIAQSGAGIRVAGWAIDPDTTAPIDVQVKVEGQAVRDVRADLVRPDVGAAFPGRGSFHGFDFTVPDLGPGKRQVCVWVSDVGVGGDTRVLGCKDVVIQVDPFGAIDAVTTLANGMIRVTGWVADPETTDPTDVGIVLDGARVVVQPTDIARPDVQAVYGLGLLRGYDIRFPATPGSHTVCVVAGNVGWGSARFIGCSPVVVPLTDDRRPDLRLSSVTPVDATTVRVRGTVTDPDGPGPITVDVRIDGGEIRSSASVGGVVDMTIGGLAPGRHQ
ncbi:MAG: hypothetical protein JST64_14340, partial [Actinobacteria bacterium]|nr:hypothetical protein [Actinomycetota bacterium]